jgi:hypothetical protein
MVELINSMPDFSDAFDDKRINKRAEEALRRLVFTRTSSIRQISENAAQQKAFYRLLDNPSFSESSIEQSIIKRCSQLATGRHVLCIQDSSEFNLSAQKGRIKKESGIGKTTKEGILGFMVHACFVVDAEKGSALGYSYLKPWHRCEQQPDRHARNYKGQSIENKESYRWVEATEQSRVELGKARQITVVADREADIYDLFARHTGTNVHLLIRSNSNRKINKGDETLREYLDKQPALHRYKVALNGDIRKGIIKHIAEVEVKWSTVLIKKPWSCNDTSLPELIPVTVVEVKEVNKSNGLYWRILTTHAVNNVQDAEQIINWYKHRWYIEQVFRLLKLQGFRMESSQLESGWAIRKLTLLAMMAVLRILQMMIAYEDDHDQPIEEVFTEEEQQCMEEVNKKLEGDTEKQTNPHAVKTMKWAAWIIARLGGWKGYASQRKPGPIVLHKGFTKFYQLFEGWALAKTYFKNVGTQ